MAEELNLNQGQEWYPHRVVKFERLNNGKIDAYTFADTNHLIDLDFDDEIKNIIFKKADEEQDGWQIEKDQMQKEAFAKEQAYTKKKSELESTITTERAEKTKALNRASSAEAEAERLRTEVKASNNKLISFLSGGLHEEAKLEEIRKFAEWEPKLSIDAGDAYRIGDVLYIAKQDHVSSDKNSPTSTSAAKYWSGGNIKQTQPEPVVGYKYPKGTEYQYMGVFYFAKVDTNSTPEEAPFDWDVIDNMDD